MGKGPSPLPIPSHVTIETHPHSPSQASQEPAVPVPDVDGNEGAVDSLDASIDRLPLHARTAWSWLEVIIEVKASPKRAPFACGPHIKPGQFLSHAYGDEHGISRGQSLQYCLQVLHRQHRIFVFTISICGNGYARFVRVDHSSALVSEQFHYLTQPDIIGTFLYRLAKLDMAGRGHDPTATLATKDEADKFAALKAQYQNSPSIVHILEKATTEGWPTYKLTVNCAETRPAVQCETSIEGDPDGARPPPSPREYLVCRPTYTSRSIIGRATKGFVALDLKENVAVFLKDTWRPSEEAVRTEKSIYEHLWRQPAANMHIPTLLLGDDVRVPGFPPQCTFVPYGAGGTPRVHSRLVFKEVCRGLEDFKGSRELVHAIRDALRGHRWAWEERKMLHRDVSVGNILIYDDPEKPGSQSKGLLCDWELAKSEAEIQNPRASQASRSGTLQFMSALLSWYPQKDHLLSDDLESFMHVLTWCTMMYLPNDAAYSEEKLASTMWNYFDEHSRDHRGSFGKFKSVRKGVSPVVGLPEYHPLNVLIEDLASLCKDHYKTPGMIEKLELTSPFPTIGGPRSLVASDGTVEQDDSHSPEPGFDEDNSTVETEEVQLLPQAQTFVSPLNDHVRFAAAFGRAVGSKNWPLLVKKPKTRRVLIYTPLASRMGTKRTTSTVGESGDSQAHNKRARADEAQVALAGMVQLRLSTPHGEPEDVFS
ncbi:hypothetical protein C8Q78DRAFT_981280 [Trametes maxima]|nr:hypothetical protein C8Q78DRAFT_981280 [Trametes maxima]